MDKGNEKDNKIKTTEIKSKTKKACRENDRDHENDKGKKNDNLSTEIKNKQRHRLLLKESKEKTKKMKKRQIKKNDNDLSNAKENDILYKSDSAEKRQYNYNYSDLRNTIKQQNNSTYSTLLEERLKTIND